MKHSWFMALLLLFVGGISFIILFVPPPSKWKTESPKTEATTTPTIVAPKEPVYTACPAPDTITYPDKLPQQFSFTCPLKDQQLTVVREPNYMTYIRCSCPK